MIRVQNIYHMLAYAFQMLNERGYRDLAVEDYENVAEMCSAILIKGISTQVKRGLTKEYVPKMETLSSLRGKIDVSESLKTMAIEKMQLACSYDEFSVNSYMNQIIKSTAVLLMHSGISKARAKELRKLMLFFSDVDTVNLQRINWNQQYNRNNQSYRMLMAICYLVVKGLLQTQSDGSVKMMDFLDEQRMCRLYEKFILEYFRKEHPEIKANASQIPWQLDDNENGMLPVMQSDIMLRRGEKVLIIDAKYYAHTLHQKYDKKTIHSGNIYQIFTYVKNKEAELSGQPHEVSGMLLYARTDEDIYPEIEYKMSGNRIAVRTLNLDTDFSLIRKQLDEIGKRYLG